jgi:hypothetical protein
VKHSLRLRQAMRCSPEERRPTGIGARRGWRVPAAGVLWEGTTVEDVKEDGRRGG